MTKKDRTQVDYTGLKTAIDSVRDDEVWLNAPYGRKMRFIIMSYLMLMGLLPAQANEDLSKYHYTKRD